MSPQAIFVRLHSSKSDMLTLEWSSGRFARFLLTNRSIVISPLASIAQRLPNVLGRKPALVNFVRHLSIFDTL
ncbi:unnamed protein product [Cylicocyclus nassatus]|uniref:Uncharacterized protein n=1 Tax=Cylicocyclus nassatus TaxID=53992 RepID=A0AA36DL15_CYLNA|nr:unnamed protein product [Cylicocyclus nassatus]